MEILEKNNNNNIQETIVVTPPRTIFLIFDSCYIMGASCHPSLPSSDLVPNNTQLLSATGHRAFTHIILNSITA